MKKDLATAIIAAVAGTVIAYIATNFLIPPIENVTYKTIDEEVSIDLPEPNAEIFNYRALNPTVEVFVGNCTEFNENGECINNGTIINDIEEITGDGTIEDIEFETDFEVE